MGGAQAEARSDNGLAAEVIEQVRRYECGEDVTWDDQLPPGRVVALPAYPWRHARYWIETKPEPPATAQPEAFLGELRPSPLSSILREARWEAGSPALFDDHRLYGRVVVPGAAHLAMVCSALRVDHRVARPGVKRVHFERPLILDGHSTWNVQLAVQDGEHGTASFTLYARPEDNGRAWTVLSRGELADDEDWTAPDLAALLAEGWLTRDLDRYDERARQAGLLLGPRFRRFQRLLVDEEGGRVLAKLGPVYGPRPASGADGADAGLVIDPGLLDCCFQALLAGRWLADPVAEPLLFIPWSVGALHVLGPIPDHLWCYAERSPGSTDQAMAGDLFLYKEDGDVIAVVRDLRMARASREALDQRPTPTLQAVRWRPVSAPPPAEGPTEGTWLVVGTDAEFATAVAERLETSGAQVLVNGSPDPSMSQQLDGVLYIDNSDEQYAGGSVLDHELASCTSALALVRMLLAQERPGRLWIATRGAVAGAGCTGSSLWGFGRTIAREHAELWGGLVDLPPGESHGADELVALIQGGQGVEVALRDGRLLQPTSEALPIDGRVPPLRADRTWLVTGGAGGLGTHLVRWLIGAGARHVAILGRSQPHAADPHSSAGVQIARLRADVSREEDLRGALDELARDMPPLGGIFHLAGVVDDASLTRLDPPALRTVMTPKIAGAWNLHRLSLDLALDRFVLFSSVASTTGNPGQAHYAAANAFMDALAAHRRALGLPGLSVGWGPWTGEGMASALSARELSRLSAAGIHPLRPEDARDLFGGALATDEAHVTAGVFEPGLFTLGAGQISPPRTGATESPASDLRARLAATPSKDRRELLARHVTSRLRETMGSRVDLPGDAPIETLGLDSLAAVSVVQALRADLACDLPVTLLLDHDTVDAVVDAVLEELGL